MKHLKLFFACLLMAVLSIGQMWATTYKLTKVTSVETGKLYVFERNSHVFNNTSSSSALQTTATYKTTGLEGTESYVWTLETATGGFYLKNVSLASNQYLNNASKTTVSFGAASSIWTIAFTGEVALISNTSNSNRFLGDAGKDSPNNTYKAYATGNLSDYEHDITVYVLDEEGSTPVTPVAVTGVTLDQSEAEIAVGGTVTLTPTVSPSNATTKTVTWESSDDAVATVADGVVTGVAVGTATITVTTDDGDFTATCDITVTAAPAAVNYEKVTAEPADWSGEYILVYEADATNARVWKGADEANNYAEATISAGVIAAPEGAAVLTIAKVAESDPVVYTIMLGDKYIGQTSNSNGIKIQDDAINNSISYNGTDAAVDIVASSAHLRYNSASSSYFRYYKSSSYSSQKKIQLYKKAGAPAAVAKPTITGTNNFLTSTEVTIECTTDGAAIYYTTTESAKTTPATSGDWMAYNGASKPSFSSTTTVWAAAKLGDDWSEVAEKTFTKATILTTAAELVSFATTTDQQVYVNLANWKVTFVSGDYVYLVDASNEGVVLKQASHGYTAGDVLADVAYQVTAKKSSGRVQLSGFTSENISATSGTVEPSDVTDYSTITAANQSALVTLKEATYDATSGTFSDGVNEIYFFDQFSASPTLIDGKNYDVTGIVIYYKTNTAEKVEIAPRTSGDVVPNEVIVIPTAANLAALKAATRGTYILTLTNAVVTYVNGKNAFIEDATGGALIFIQDHGYTAGNCLNGDYQVTTTDYQGKFEITAIEPQAGAATTTADIPLTTVSIATLNASFSSYESRRVKIAAANVTDAVSGSDRNGAINDGAALAVYAAAGESIITLTAGDNVDIIGYPGFHNTDQQLTVWAQADITVNVKEDPELAYDPVSETIEQGASWSAPTLVNPHSLTIASYASNNEAVATVSGEGVIDLAGGIGTAVITAHTDGDATYAAGNATYTITVNEAGVYSMSFDLSRASYDDAADEEVVWNSNVVTITAQKGSGTKVTNYLAGNYSSGTLIAETRLYENNNLVFTPKAGVTITKVEWHATAKAYAESLAKEGTTTAWTNATAALDGTDDKLVIITPSAAGDFSAVLGKSGSNKGTRALSAVVYYQAESEKAKLPASISIDDMNMAVGDDDILLSAIAATSNPNKKAISYAVTSGTAVTIEGTGAEAALHAAAEGSATITATIPDDLGNYTGATTSFMVTVAASATLESIAISGEATELVYTEGQSFNPAGLTVMGHYSNGSDAEITSGIDWTFDPDPLTEGTTSVSVTATVETISSDAIVVNGLTVSGPAPVGDNYVKVTASQADWSGDYILVYEDGANAYVWNGDYSDGASNYASATITSNTIAKPAAAAVITIAAASEGKYTLQVNGDKYFQDNGSNSKLIFTDAIADAAEVTISYETDWTKLQFSARCIRFNNASGQTRFRFYAADGQQAVQLYKKDTPEPPTPTYETVRTGLEAGRHYTVCLEKKVTAVKGATFWSLTYKNSENTAAYLVQEEAPFTAGKPYIIQATDDNEGKLEVVYEGDAAGTPVENGALRGTFSYMDADALAAVEGTVYMLFENALCPIGTNNHLDAHRAYVLYNLLTVPSGPNFAPGKKVKSMPLQKDVTTGFENLNASEKPVKLMIDGNIYILRGEKLYDATGRLVK